MIKIFTIPFSKEHETFFDDDLNQFLLNKKVEAIKAEFFKTFIQLLEKHLKGRKMILKHRRFI